MCRLLIYKGTSPVQLSHVGVFAHLVANEQADILTHRWTVASHETRSFDH
jgi:hypothetical protein